MDLHSFCFLMCTCSGQGEDFPLAITALFPQPLEQFSPLSLSQLCTAPPCLWGLVLACGLAALAGSRRPTGSNPLLLFTAHTHVCELCPRWGHFSRTAGATRSQTALNGPRQAVHINNLFRLKSSHREQQSVKCQQQKNSNWSYILQKAAEGAVFLCETSHALSRGCGVCPGCPAALSGLAPPLGRPYWRTS